MGLLQTPAVAVVADLRLDALTRPAGLGNVFCRAIERGGGAVFYLAAGVRNDLAEKRPDCDFADYSDYLFHHPRRHFESQYDSILVHRRFDLDVLSRLALSTNARLA